jgi:hypothetical protein
VATEGITGFLFDTRNYWATAAFWKSLGFENVFETDHGSGQWVHPAGGPSVFIADEQKADLQTHQAIIRDPDGRSVSIQAPEAAGQ